MCKHIILPVDIVCDCATVLEKNQIDYLNKKGIFEFRTIQYFIY